jgi:hypothetical protein
MNTALGGGPAAYSFDEMANLTNEVSQAFEGGTPSSFAQDHLVNGACPGGWQNGALVTYTQADWGDATTTAGVLLNNSFNALYGALGYVEAGIPGAAGFSMRFTSAGAVFTYQLTGLMPPIEASHPDSPLE